MFLLCTDREIWRWRPALFMPGSYWSAVDAMSMEAGLTIVQHGHRKAGSGWIGVALMAETVVLILKGRRS